MSEGVDRANAMDQLIYEIACDEFPYARYTVREVLQVQERRRRQMEEMRGLLIGETR